MEKVLIELLQEAKTERNANPLQDLRNAFGFDFNKPIKAVKFTDSFTATSLKKDYGIDVKTEQVAVIFHKGRWFEVAEFTGGEVKLADSASLSALTRLWTKSDFNEKRKDGYLTVYVIAQKDEYTLVRFKRVGWVGRATIDPNIRYKAYNDEWLNNGVVEYDKPKIWTNRIDVPFDEDFDKSGYCVAKKRDELKRKLEKLKEERGAQAYREMTNTQDMIDRAKKAIEVKQIEFSKKLAIVKTYDEIRNLDYDINRLANCFYEIEKIEKKDSAKLFSSPREFNSSIAYIYRRLDEI